jgi:hypothetical protein
MPDVTLLLTNVGSGDPDAAGQPATGKARLARG